MNKRDLDIQADYLYELLNEYFFNRIKYFFNLNSDEVNSIIASNDLRIDTSLEVEQ